MEKAKFAEPLKCSRAGSLRQQRREQPILGQDQIREIAISVLDLMGYEIVDDDEKDVEIEPPIIPK